MAYGYRESESHLIPAYKEQGDERYFVDPKTAARIAIDGSLKIIRLKLREQKSRPVVMASLGMHVPGFAFPHVDPSHAITAVAGSLYRYGRKVNYQANPDFRQFVRTWLLANLTPLSFDSDTSFESWIEKTPYTLARKEELRRKKNELGAGYELPDKYLEVKSFVKDETYPTYKHARAINSRTDEFKATVGPIFQLISDRLFALDWFIKKIPIIDRPNYILERLYRLGEKFRTTDYTSFEAHFTKECKADCEYQFYEYMTKYLPEHRQFMGLVKRSGAEKPNVIKSKDFTIEIDAKRMSGEMDTSLGNGFSNLMFMLYICNLNGNTDVKGVIEGDDGLFVMRGEPPRPELFSDFGLIIKIVDFDDLNHASFCGMVFDLEDRTNVTNPIEELVSFGWTSARYAKSSDKVHKHLLRAKALSLAYQYPACPILSTLAYKVCRLTAGYDVASFLETQGNAAFCQYEMEMVKKACEYFAKNGLTKEPGMKTRLLVEELYGVTVADQFSIESAIEAMDEVGPIDVPILGQYMQPIWADYWDRYTLNSTVDIDNDNHLVAWPEVRPSSVFSVTTGRRR